jgi:hypothetical protein
MLTDIKLNTYIEWTDEDRDDGVCPVPDGSDVTTWYSTGDVYRDCAPEFREWDHIYYHIIGYLVHSIPEAGTE